MYISSHSQIKYLPIRSSKFFRDVVPTIGADTKSLDKVHARAIWAMDTPRFLAISSTLKFTRGEIMYMSVSQGTNLLLIFTEDSPLTILTHLYNVTAMNYWYRHPRIAVNSRIRLCPCCLLANRSSKEPSRQWAPGDTADTQVFQKGHNFPLLFPVSCVMEVLHTNEGRKLVVYCIILHLLDYGWYTRVKRRKYGERVGSHCQA